MGRPLVAASLSVLIIAAFRAIVKWVARKAFSPAGRFVKPEIFSPLVARCGTPKGTLRPTGVMTLSAVEEKLKACGQGALPARKKESGAAAREKTAAEPPRPRAGREKAEGSQPQRKCKSRGRAPAPARGARKSGEKPAAEKIQEPPAAGGSEKLNRKTG